MDKTLERANSICWDRPRAATSVKFSTDRNDDEGDDEAEDEGADGRRGTKLNPAKFDANFVRHDTPHPKDLKARHQKMLQERSQKESVESSSSSSRPDLISASGSNRSHHQSRSDSVESEKLHQQSDQSSEADSVIVRTDAEVAKEKSTAVNNNFMAAAAASGNQGRKEKSVRVSLSDDHQQVFDDEENEDQVVREDGVHEMIDGHISASDNNKRVGFSRPGEEEADSRIRSGELMEETRAERHDKLHRRDTPHHLKNKRVNVTKSDQDKVASILAAASLESKTHQATNNHQSVGNSSSSLQQMSQHHVRENSRGSIGDNDSLATSVHSYHRSASKTSLLPTGPVEVKMMRVEVVKSGSGLGLSIAGGVGSNPYKGDDDGIFVSRVTEGGAAHVAGLQVSL